GLDIRDRLCVGSASYSLVECPAESFRRRARHFLRRYGGHQPVYPSMPGDQLAKISGISRETHRPQGGDETSHFQVGAFVGNCDSNRVSITERPPSKRAQRSLWPLRRNPLSE